MRIVIDANVLFRTLISPGNILDLFFDCRLEIIAPERLKQEFLNNREEISAKSGLDEQDFNALTEILFSKICFVPLKEYLSFFNGAKELLGTHIKDIEFVALAMKYDTKIWTYEKLLLDKKIGITTQELKKTIGF